MTLCNSDCDEVPARVANADEERNRKVRLYEAAFASQFMPGAGRLLEVGAGRGHQARYLASLGYDVDAIEIADTRHVARAVFDLRFYDGKEIPFHDASFDVIFSSNVLEHVHAEDQFQQELHRVLKPRGVAVHLLPSTAWRAWTTLGHYPWILQIGLARCFGATASIGSRQTEADGRAQKNFLWRRLRVAAMPIRHGVRGNWVTELYHFSRFRWKATFRRGGFDLLKGVPCGLFYGGHQITGIAMSIEWRRRLSRGFGSGSICYVLRRR